MEVYARVANEAPELIEYLRERHPGTDPYQSLKWFLPDDLGFTTS
jgi:hypothetical protein